MCSALLQQICSHAGSWADLFSPSSRGCSPRYQNLPSQTQSSLQGSVRVPSWDHTVIKTGSVQHPAQTITMACIHVLDQNF